MTIKQFGHLSFNCKNLQKSVAFYESLGCKRKFSIAYDVICDRVEKGFAAKNKKLPKLLLNRIEKMRGRTWLIYLEFADGVFVELFDQIGAKKMHLPNNRRHYNYQHFALIVDDIQSVKEELVKNGVEIDADISLGLDDTYQMWIHDPDGNKFEIMQYTEKSLQLLGN